MKIKKNNWISYIYYLSVFLVVSLVGIFYWSKKNLITADEDKNQFFDSSSLNSFLKDFMPWAISVSGGLAIIVLIYAGYMYVTSAGNVDQINKAKEFITGALIGLGFLMSAGLIYNTLLSPISTTIK